MGCAQMVRSRASPGQEAGHASSASQYWSQSWLVTLTSESGGSGAAVTVTVTVTVAGVGNAEASPSPPHAVNNRVAAAQRTVSARLMSPPGRFWCAGKLPGLVSLSWVPMPVGRVVFTSRSGRGAPRGGDGHTHRVPLRAAQGHRCRARITSAVPGGGPTRCQ